MTLYRGYVGAARACSGGPTIGAKALMSWFLGAFPGLARNDGIYNCRDQRGSTAPSVHGEGRADDLGCAAGAEWAQVLADLLVEFSAELGIQCVIFNRHVWSGAYPDAGWRPYKGVDGHTTHLHVELSKKAAAGLTVARIQKVLGPHLEDQMTTITKEQLHDIAHAVWTIDEIVNANAPADSKNPTWSPASMLSNLEDTQDQNTGSLKRIEARVAGLDLAALQKLVNDLTVTVAQLGRTAGTGGVDLAALVRALVPALAPAVAQQVAPVVLDGLAARLKS